MPRRGAKTSRLRRAPGPRLNVPPPGMLSACECRKSCHPHLTWDSCTGLIWGERQRANLVPGLNSSCDLPLALPDLRPAVRLAGPAAPL